MIQELCIEAEAGSSAELLVDVVYALRGVTLPPLSFVWSVAQSTAEARVWMALKERHDKLREVMSKLRGIPAVRRVSLLRPGPERDCRNGSPKLTL
jgi:hypothetical protein